MSNPVEELLRKNGVTFSIQGHDFITRCFNPDHDDNSPSFRVDQVTGMGHCFSCGFKFKPDIFKYYGILGVPNSIKAAKLKEKLAKLKEVMYGLEMPKGAQPFTRSFRNVSIKTLERFEALYTNEVTELEDRIVFPVRNLSGKISAFVARHILSNGNPRYIIYPRHSVVPLLPAKLEIPSTSIVLVEGIFDMLNLYDKGLTNVVCAFGTSTMKTQAETKLLPFKAGGVTKIYLMFDGDTAGTTAAEELKPILEELGYIVEIITLQEDTDPGDLSQQDVDSIKEYIK